MKYDSKPDTIEHIRRVQELMNIGANILVNRGIVHDQSKLQSPEKEGFDEYTPKLKGSVYGSDDYKALLAGLDVALQHHYANNTHHPEHYPNGIDDMDLFDVIEMFFDWKAATERHSTGDINKSIDINETRFKMSTQLAQIFRNTVKNLKWEKVKRKFEKTRPTGLKGAILHFLWRLGIGGLPNHVTWESQYK